MYRILKALAELQIRKLGITFGAEEEAGLISREIGIMQPGLSVIFQSILLYRPRICPGSKHHSTREESILKDRRDSGYNSTTGPSDKGTERRERSRRRRNLGVK